VRALLNIPGLGPKAVARLRSELGVLSLDDLRRALDAHSLRELKGFGPKSEDKLRQSLERMAQQGALSRTPISIALPHAQRILAHLCDVPGVTHATYAGSLRRFSETIGDIDLIVTAAAAEPVMQALVDFHLVERVIGRGDNKTSVVTRRGMQIDLRVVAEHQLGAALLYFTGSKGHNIKLRQRALTRGWTLNEYALSEIEGGKIVASVSEEEIYHALGLPFIPPVLREDWGEIEAAESGSLPKPLPPVIGDFHVHTTVSGDGRSPLGDMIAAAKARGYKVLAITDHAEGTLSGVSREALIQQRAAITAAQAELGDSLRLLHGVELNIGPHGELDFDPEFRAEFDFCLASVHSHYDLTKEQQTRRVVKAMEDPSVRMIGHLSARMIGHRPGIELDLDIVLAAAEHTGTALEVNGALPRLDLSVEALRRAGKSKAQLVLTSDAHHTSELDRMRTAVLNAERAWADAEQVVNTWPPERLLEWATAR
jgi:DNA polymerase (family 10)